MEMDAADGGSGREMDAEGGGPGTGDGAEGRAGTSRFWQPPTLLGKQLMHTPPYFTQTQFLHFP